MTVGYLYHPVFLEHRQTDHPENPARLEAIMSRLRREGMLNQLVDLPFTPASQDQLGRVHDPTYIVTLEQFARQGGGMVDSDTYVNSASFRAASAAAGAAIAATRSVLTGTVQRAFALVRPPGHHASADQAGGFCLFNNVAFAVRQALGDLNPSDSSEQINKVLIVDFDIHHGNGTQAIFYMDPRVLYISMHQWPLYPGTGRIYERGSGEAIGTTVNIPLPPGVGDNGYAQVLDEVIVPLARRYQPGLLVVSAGYDAHWMERIYRAQMALSLKGYHHLVSTLVDISNEVCRGHMVCVLEGGYDPDVLSYGVLNTFYALMENSDRVQDPLGGSPDRETSARRVIEQVKQLNGL